MKKLLLPTILLLNINILLSQNSVEWVKEKPYHEYYQSHTWLTDKYGNIHEFGSRADKTYHVNFYGQSYDTLGSVKATYDTKGNLLNTKYWSKKFYIMDVDYDGNEIFYFCGFFIDQVVIDSFIINSGPYGDYDAMIGAMDLNGNIKWLNTFGGDNKDYCTSLDYEENFIYTTGLIDGGWYSGTNNMFVKKFSVSGVETSSQILDFLSNESYIYGANIGWEIKVSNDEIFLLHEREGRSAHRGDAPATVPMLGMYIMKLSNEKEIWSKLLFSECEYGCSAFELDLDNLENLFFISSHAGKGSSSWSLNSWNKNTGTENWKKTKGYNGYYGLNDLLLNSGNIYLAGGWGTWWDNIYLLDLNGNIIEFTISSKLHINKLILNNSNELYMVGSTDEDSLKAEDGSFVVPRTMFIAKLNSNGLTTINESKSISNNIIYPNPTQGKFTIEFNSPVNNLSVKNILGQEVFHQNLQSSSNGEYAIDLSNQPKGIYFLEISSGEVKETRKVVVQ